MVTDIQSKAQLYPSQTKYPSIQGETYCLASVSSFVLLLTYSL